MIKNSTECKNCIKQDVCNIKDAYAFSVDELSSVNTDKTLNTDNTIVFLVKDNPNVTVSVSCTKFFLNSLVR